MFNIQKLYEIKKPIIYYLNKEEFNQTLQVIKKNNDLLYGLIDGTKCPNERDMFIRFQQVFKFPYYFGHNWDALDECISDLDWLDTDKFKGIVILISNTKELLKENKEDLKILYGAFDYAYGEWSEDDQWGHKQPFHVIMEEE
jgi:RNAse (barnase) inhibitor barstar